MIIKASKTLQSIHIILGLQCDHVLHNIYPIHLKNIIFYPLADKPLNFLSPFKYHLTKQHTFFRYQCILSPLFGAI
ncbi:hypothetical protein B9T26_11560 [Acinetobacter sp. ANC 4169]|nr:hypothetical protein B9T26_11560 [Acinetobacter sp. ANC 4169]